jgi:dienelactone hydrolase
LLPIVRSRHPRRRALPKAILEEGGRGRPLHGWSAHYPGGCPGSGDDAGACFYGIPPLEAADWKKIKSPLICHFANKDDWCTPTKVNELEAALKQSKSEFEIYRYDAHHACMNEARPEVYDPACAKTAWERTLKFLKKALT